MDELLSHGSWDLWISISLRFVFLCTAGVYVILFAVARKGWIEDRERERDQQRRERKPPHIDSHID